MQYRYRAICLRRPIGPWRTSRDLARRDLVALDLGAYDEWGRFFIVVPGDMEWEYVAHQSRAA